MSVICLNRGAKNRSAAAFHETGSALAACGDETFDHRLLDLRSLTNRVTADLREYPQMTPNSMRTDRTCSTTSLGAPLSSQAFNLIGDLTVWENVELPLTYRDMDAAERQERVGMTHRAKPYPPQRLGGQPQRVAVARAVAADPAILLPDAPTGNRDFKNGDAVMDLLRQLHDTAPPSAW